MAEGPLLNVGHLPKRKSPALYEELGGEIRVLAYFRSERAYKRFLAYKLNYYPPCDAWPRDD